jgi:6-phosphogluconolactonase
VSGGPQRRWHHYPTAEQLVRAAVGRLAQHAAAAIAARGRFCIVLSGGSTPRPLYAEAVRIDTGWNCWHVYFADERCLPAGHADRNDTMARQVWLDHVPIPEHQVHVIPAERGPEEAAAAYRQTLEHVGTFDLVLLGLGDDGHTASLFPGHDTGAQRGSPDVLAVFGAPKPPRERVSLSAARLSNARAVEVLVAGRGKRDAVSRLRQGSDYPVCAVVPESGVDVLLDQEAAGRSSAE